jgi:hypothetical protein
MLFSLSIYSQELCSIEVDYLVGSKWGASGRTEHDIKKNTKSKIIKKLQDKGYSNISFFDLYSFSKPAQYALKVRGSVVARAGTFCGGQKKSCLEESAEVKLLINGSLVSRAKEAQKEKRRVTRILTDVDYLIDPRDENNSRVSTILNKNRLDKLILKLVSQVEDCPHSIFVNNESLPKDTEVLQDKSNTKATVIER